MKYILYNCCLLLLISCESFDDKRLAYALEFAGDNKAELEKVLTHYHNDKLKLQAARFLIENMPEKYALHGGYLDSIKTVFKKAVLRDSHLDEIYIEQADLNRWKFFSPNSLNKKFDCHHITADFLIQNIELSFHVWEKYPWNKHLGFDEFCEYILPYRIGNEPLENWRKLFHEKYTPMLDSLYQGSDVVDACNIAIEILKEEKFFYVSDFNIPSMGGAFLFMNRIGACQEACDIALYTMRSIGIPSTTDFMYHSPEYQGSHSWNAVRDTTGIFLPFWYTIFNAKRSLEDDGRKKGKVFRQLFGLQKDKLKTQENENIIPLLSNPFIEDVSENYFRNRVTIEVKDYSKTGYLGVFSSSGWEAIEKCTIRNNKMECKNIEPYLVYQPISTNNRRNHIAYPFIFDGTNAISLIPDTTVWETISINRKYPLKPHIFGYMNENVIGSELKGSLNLTFNNAKTLYQVKDTVRTNRNLILFLGDDNNYRYLKWSSPVGRHIVLAELSILDSETLNPIPYKVLNINDAKPFRINKTEFLIENLFDNNPLTFYYSKDTTFSLILDLNKICNIGGVLFIPRNDDNFIWPGDLYELFYNDGINGWISLGKKQAMESVLEYNAPKGALLWLKNHTKGKEEQVFVWKNNRQVFPREMDSLFN